MPFTRKLTPAAVHAIRTSTRKYGRIRRLAQLYGVSTETIRRVIRFEVYKR